MLIFSVLIIYFVATLFVETMNKSVDPCTDFYQFACGNYGKLHRITKPFDRFVELHDFMMIYIKGVFIIL